MLKNNVPGYIKSDGNLNTVYILYLNKKVYYNLVCLQCVSRIKGQQKTRAVRNNKESLMEGIYEYVRRPRG